MSSSRKQLYQVSVVSSHHSISYSSIFHINASLMYTILCVCLRALQRERRACSVWQWGVNQKSRPPWWSLWQQPVSDTPEREKDALEICEIQIFALLDQIVWMWWRKIKESINQNSIMDKFYFCVSSGCVCGASVFLQASVFCWSLIILIWRMSLTVATIDSLFQQGPTGLLVSFRHTQQDWDGTNIIRGRRATLVRLKE